MDVTPAVEDYLKAVWQLTTTGRAATTGALAEWMAVSPPSVSAMLRRLEAGGLAQRRAEGVVLTANGVEQTLRVVRRHRLLETFLADVVGLPWDEVHAEAEALEHAVSPRLEARIDALLGHPTRDPHGDPIPPREGAHDESWADPLLGVPSGARFRVERVSDRDAGALRYLDSLGIRPGVELEVGPQEPYGGPLWVTVTGEAGRRPLGADLARLLHGDVAERPGGDSRGPDSPGPEDGRGGREAPAAEVAP
jgi:DtxR family Mn-dependent transcriptional regulator